jgi:WD40 repeat protein
VNLHGPVRVSDGAAAGEATMIVRFDAWKEAGVAASTHKITVKKPKVQLTLEPVAPELTRTLVHPDRKASTGHIHFSKDGGKVMVAGYPSGVVQIFDLATGKELRRITTKPGGRSSADYAAVDPGWKTLYVAVENRGVERTVKDGRTVTMRKYAGEIRVFDLTTGEEKPPLKHDNNGSVSYIRMSADGKTLFAIENATGLKENGEPTITTSAIEWDLVSGTHRKIADGYRNDVRSADGRWLATSVTDYEKLTTLLKVTDTKSGKETTLIDARNQAVGFVVLSKDGRHLVATVRGFGRDGTTQVKVWELPTLKEIEVPPGHGAILELAFSPDGEYLALWDLDRGTRLISTRTWKEHALTGKDAKDKFQRWAFSPDGRRLALVATRYPPGTDYQRDPDPLDHVQSRIYVYDLQSTGPPMVLVCPQGFMTKLEFDPKGRWLAAGASGGVWLFSVK